ncbi:type III polyketide synthase [Rubellimicrobium sp. CFH 75288]|uniref:type III polyketide synthase n=1 Tax=Rubellimicrobium sp. CFH 75288 TaxID=2697034 RepID=UPI0014133DD0|nr:type III polyketide synthase [Rubellimicrobium sp. CFH 75288]NAZ36026.1 type III polyketide synthase [Rubellimicrobium sp. CFH 75288]
MTIQAAGAPVRLLSLATALPPHRLLQADVAREAARMWGDRIEDWGRLSAIFASAGIDRRHSVVPLEWFLRPRGWPDRTAAYLNGADALFVEAAGRALDRAGLRAADVGTVVTVSSTGIATPSIEARVAERMGFGPHVHRVPVFGLGCAGGITGLGLAARLARGEPEHVVLMVTIELCTLSFRLEDTSKANLVATALFGDGAAACVLRAGEGGVAEVEAAAEHRWPDTLGIMGWDVTETGLGVIFDRAIPPFAEERLGAAMDALLGRAGLSRAEIDRFTCHPGGAKVVAALERALGLPQGSLDHERAVLRECGNMSAPTALFVLERAGFGSGRQAVTALGPGFTASTAILRAA